MTGFRDIVFSVAEPVARITIARPAKLNALRGETVDEILRALRLAEADPQIGCLVLTGEGRGFSAGYDLSTVPRTAPPHLDEVLRRHFDPLVAALRQSHLPIVAAVNGACAGAAVGLALACDVVIAQRDAYFYEPFVGLGLVPDAGNTVFLTRMLGRGRAAAMMLLGDRITAQEARDWGLVWRVLPAETFEAEVARTAAGLAAQPRHAVAATKRLIGEACEADLGERLAAERTAQGIAGRGDEVKAAIARFFGERRGRDEKSR